MSSHELHFLIVRMLKEAINTFLRTKHLIFAVNF